MATLHKFVAETPTSLTINSLNNTVVNKPSYWIPNEGYSGYTLQYVDVSSVKNKGIEIVLPYSTTKFLSHDDFSTNTVHCQEITPPSPTIVDGKYHYVFGPNTFQYNKVVAVGSLIKNSGVNHYYSTRSITSAATASAWADVNIPEFASGLTFTTKTFDTGNTTYQYSNIYYQSYNYYIGQISQSSSGKLKYFALPAGVKQFYTTSPRIAVTETMAVGQWVQYFFPKKTVGNKYYYDISKYTFPANYVILLDDSGSKGYDGVGGVDEVDWYAGTIHSRVSGSWT